MESRLLGRLLVKVGPSSDEDLIRGLLDTGVSINIISSAYCSQNGLSFIERKTSIKGWSESNAITEIIGELEDNLWIARRKIKMSFAVVKPETTKHDIILGLPFIYNTKASFT